MSIFKNIFKRKSTTNEETTSDLVEKPTFSNAAFWDWFLTHEQAFYKAVNTGERIEQDFFNVLAPKLNQLRKGYWYLTGMISEEQAELIITPDGDLKNFVFVQELIDAAPKLDNWVFTAFKPELKKSDCEINFAGIPIGSKNLFFEHISNEEYPDDIVIKVYCTDYSKENAEKLTNGIFIYLDNFLGEVKFALDVDFVEIADTAVLNDNCAPIEKLKDYIIWRKKEFIEQYANITFLKRLDNCKYYNLEGTTRSDTPFLASINDDLMNWEDKVSHPFLLKIEIGYKGNKDLLPSPDMFQRMNDFENSLDEKLLPEQGFLNVARTLGENMREIYIATRDFYQASKVCQETLDEYGFKQASYDIFKDKYWRALNYLKKPL
jgi:hypothetical protein